MSLKNGLKLLPFVLLGLLILSFIPFWLEPYEHKERVDFWTWLKRELVELREGEK